MKIQTGHLQQEKLKNIALSTKVASEQIRILYENLILGVLGSFICAIAVFYILYLNNNQRIVFIWGGLFLLISLLRLSLLYTFNHLNWPDKVNLAVFIALTLASATLWGVADSILMPVNDTHGQLVIVTVIAALSAAGIHTLQANLIASIGFLSLLLIPECLWFYAQDKFEYFILSGLNFVYFVFLTIMAWRSYTLLRTNLELAYKNIGLVETLTTSNQQLQQSHQLLSKNEARFHELMLNTPIGTAMADFQGNFIDVNDAFCNLFGYKKDELLKMKFQMLSLPDDLPKEMELINQVIAGKLKSFQLEKRYIHKDGHLLWMLLTVTTINSDSGRIFEGQLQDIHERKDSELKLMQLNENMSITLLELKHREHEENIINKLNASLQICTTVEEAYPRISIAAQDIFPEFSGGLAIYHASTQHMETVNQWGKDQLLQPFFSPDDCFAIRSGNVTIVNDPEKAVPCNHYISPPQGGYIGLPMFVQKELVGLIHLILPQAQEIPKHTEDLAISFSNIVKIALVNISLRQSLQALSLHDPLTGLFNRRYLMEYMPRELARIERDKTKLITAMLDIDDFKKFNDTYGHEAGDEVLKFIGHILNENFRASDMACRFGGEEFIVVMINVDLNAAVKKLEELCKKIKNKTIIYQGHHLPNITVSIGVSVAPENGVTTDELIEAADRALYVAKRSGKDRIEVTTPTSSRTE